MISLAQAGSSTGVDHLTHNPEIDGSNPTSDTRREIENAIEECVLDTNAGKQLS